MSRKKWPTIFSAARHNPIALNNLKSDFLLTSNIFVEIFLYAYWIIIGFNLWTNLKKLLILFKITSAFHMGLCPPPRIFEAPWFTPCWEKGKGPFFPSAIFSWYQIFYPCATSTRWKKPNETEKSRKNHITLIFSTNIVANSKSINIRVFYGICF